MSYQINKAMIDVDKIYRTKWETLDNANAMVEPTTFCQLKCPKCYRGVNLLGHCPKHRDFNDLKKEIDSLVSMRNIETVTLGGGDPLLYPELLELISYCRKNKVKVRICTNAVALDRELLIQLKNVGTSEILIHLDKYQDRGDENEQFQLRENLCELFREFPEINLGFMTMIQEVKSDNLDRLASFYIENADIIRLVSFIFTKDINNVQVQNKVITEKLEELIDFLSKKYSCKPAAYFGKKINKKTPSWLIFVPIFSDKKTIGYVDSFIYGISSNLARFIKGKHWFLTNKNTIRPWKLFFGIFNQNTRMTLWRYIRESFLKNFSNRMHYQIITVNFGPDLTTDGWDLCDPCPDAMLYKGKLVPSCLLERIKKGEKITF